MNVQIDDVERDEIFARLKANPENNKCFDCGKKNPKWSSVNLGLYLCLDCAGKHREYGPQFSFARSLNLDTWNKRYITFMELGGNPKALEYFNKHGLKAPYDYKGAIIQKYKADLTKKVDATLAAQEGIKAQDEASKSVFTSKPAEEERPKSDKVETSTSGLIQKTNSDQNKSPNKVDDDPFAEVMLNKNQVQTKGFNVEFKNKATSSGSKGRIAAKKIDNIDISQLSLNEDGTTAMKNKFDMNDSPFGIKSDSNVKEVYSKGNSPFLPDETTDDKLKKYSTAKAISSDAFKDPKLSEPANMRKFAGASGISSAQYFGDKEDVREEDDYYQAGENVKDFFSTVGGKLKEKADVFVNKLRDEWSQ